MARIDSELVERGNSPGKFKLCNADLSQCFEIDDGVMIDVRNIVSKAISDVTPEIERNLLDFNRKLRSLRGEKKPSGEPW